MKTAISTPMPMDFSDYEVVPRQFFRNTARPDALFSSSGFRFNDAAVAALNGVEDITLLVNPDEKALIIRPAEKKDRSSVRWVTTQDQQALPADIEAAAFLSRLYGIIGWNPVMNYRAFGRLLKTQTGPMLLFSLQDAETVVKPENTRIKSADFPTKFGLPASENLRHNSTPQH